MKPLLPICILSAVMALPAHASECVDTKEITGLTLASGSSGATQQTITIWYDSDSRVIYDMQPQGITRVYLKYSEDAIAYEEYFNAERIGVEHEPSPSNVAGGWNEVTNFISNAALAALEETQTGTYDCYSTTTYAGTHNGQELKVTMINELALPVSIARVSVAGHVKWELSRLETSDTESAEILQKLSSYKTYDFADLGDHEDEIFFRSSGYLKYKLGHQHDDEHDH